MGRSRGPLLLLVTLFTQAPVGTALAAGAEDAARDLISRVAGSAAASHFVLELVAQQGGKDVMGLGAQDGKVLLQGSSAVSLASAFNWYLNDFLNTTYDWSTYEVFVPTALPLPPAQSRPRVVRFSYHLNVCTFGYSLDFVDWTYWEKHIDWMAMQGINLPLAFLGQEKVMELTFARFGITLEEMQQFFSGPAFLPWFRMGNVQAWGGPLARSWIEGRVELQKQVLSRMRALGMTPALPAFAGFLPPAFVAKFPKANVTESAQWNSFPRPYGYVSLLEPTDSLFQEVGKAFIEEQTKLYGTDHIYQCDTYNEMDPRSGDLDYLRASSRAVLSAMQAADPDAIWLMQGWLFDSLPQGFWTVERAEAYLTAVPNDKMWILDLEAAAKPIWSKTKSFFGKSFVYNTLHNFGGQQGIIGNLPAVHNGMQAALTSSSSLAGVGITMEGMWTNYILFEYTLLAAWDRAGDPETFARAFGTRRYGPLGSNAAGKIWAELYALAYQNDGIPRCGPIANRPWWDGGEAADTSAEDFRFGKVWSALLALAPQLGSVKAYRFDLIDVGREVLNEAFQRHRMAFQAAVTAKNLQEAQAAGQAMLATIDDFDRLLSTDENFMLGRWLKWANSWGRTDDEQRLLNFNARNQITLWGPTGQINDYATKEWGGLTRAYFKPRWSLFIRRVLDALVAGQPFVSEKFKEEVLQSVELPWQNATDTFPCSPEEDAVEVSKVLHQKYAGDKGAVEDIAIVL